MRFYPAYGNNVHNYVDTKQIGGHTPIKCNEKRIKFCPPSFVVPNAAASILMEHENIWNVVIIQY